MRTIEEMLQSLGRPGVTEFALVSDRLPCVKVNGAFKPVDDYAPKTDEILQMLVAAGGSWYIASLGPTATQWAINVEGVGMVGVQVIMRDRAVQARFMVTQRAGAAAPVPQPPPRPPTANRPPATLPGVPPPKAAPPPPSSAVALIANEPFGDDQPRSLSSAGLPSQRDPRARIAPRAPLPAPSLPPLMATEPGEESKPDDDVFDFPTRKAPLPAPAPPEALVPTWAATQAAASSMRSPQASRPELTLPEPAGPADAMDARAEMDSLVLRLAEELDVGPRRVRVVIELVLETIDRTGLPPREALEALAAAEKAAKKK